MSEIQHKSLKAELLYLIGRSTAPLNSVELYERCELAEEIVQVGKALANLQADNKIVRVAGEGRARYSLAAGVSAPAPVGKPGRSKAVQADDAAQAGGAEGGLPAINIPTLTATPSTAESGKPAKTIKPARAGKKTASGESYGQSPVLTVHDLNAASLADAILAKTREQLTQAAVAPAAVLDATAAPAIHITVHIEQVDIHLGGLYPEGHK